MLELKELTQEEYEAQMRKKLDEKGLYDAVKDICDDIAEESRGFSHAHFGLITEWLCDILKLIELSGWIPVRWREPNEEEAEYYNYMADCPMPDDGEEILVTNSKHVWKDEAGIDDGLYLYSGSDWGDITAWMPLPKPYKEVGI